MKKKDKTRAVGKYYVKEESREHRVKTKKKGRESGGEEKGVCDQIRNRNSEKIM